jgi:hypothetical protein
MNARTVKNLKNVHPVLDAIIRANWAQIDEIGAKFDATISIICGHRPQAEQDRLYKIGRRGIAGERKVTWTRKSKHTMTPAKAIDFGCFRGNQYLDAIEPRTARKIYLMISAHLAKYSEIRWGGEFGDDPHFELRF